MSERRQEVKVAPQFSDLFFFLYSLKVASHVEKSAPT